MGHVMVPERLLEVVQQNNEKAYPQIIMDEASYPYLFHLSDIRQNLIAFLPVTKQMRVLERNAGCGALTGKLLSMALHVTAAVESMEEAEILRARYKDADNLTVSVISDADTGTEKNVLYRDQTYDMILIAGEFSRYQKELSCMREHLADSGKLYVADANRLGLKYFAGCQEEYRGGYFTGLENYDENPRIFTADEGDGKYRTYTRKEYEQILKEAGFPEIYVYYPYPDHKFPACIYSDEYLPGKGELSDNRRNFDRDRVQLFDEKKVFDTVLAEGLFGELTNSFLIEAGNKTEEKRVIYSKYSNERARQFAIRTDICKNTDGEKNVKKYALYPEGKEHICHMEMAYERLTSCYEDGRDKIAFCACHTKNDVSVSAFDSGTTLQDVMERALEANQTELVKNILDDYAKRIMEYGGKKRFVLTEDFKKVFGEVDFTEEPEAVDTCDIDMIFANILIPKGSENKIGQAKWTVIDYEWTFFFPVPKLFVLYRALYFAYYQIMGGRGTSLDELLASYGIDQTLKEQFGRMEENFQAYLGKGNVPVRNMQRVMGTKIIPFEQLTDQDTKCAKTEEKIQNEPAGVRKILYHIDRQEYQDGSVVCSGWALAKTWSGKILPVDIKAVMQDGTAVTAELARYARTDVADALKLRRACDVNWGFDCVFVAPREERWKLVFSLGKRSAEYCYRNE